MNTLCVCVCVCVCGRAAANDGLYYTIIFYSINKKCNIESILSVMVFICVVSFVRINKKHNEKIYIFMYFIHKRIF